MTADIGFLMVTLPVIGAAAVPIWIAPRLSAWSYDIVPLPAWVSATGMPVASANAVSAAVASE